MADESKGLTCPACAHAVPIPEGARFVTCPSCQQRSFVQGDRGVQRWQVRRAIDRAQAIQTVTAFFNGLDKAIGLKQRAEITEVFLAYLPFWRVKAQVAGWRLGRVRQDKNSTRPIELEVLESMQWGDAAADVSEFGVQQVPFPARGLEPFNQDVLSREGMVFEPAESETETLAEAADHFTYKSREKRSLSATYFEKFYVLREQLAVVYYPLWVARYQYRQRSYQVVVDGLQNKILYGKAPGNILYRAAMLVLGMSIGNFLLVHGTLFAVQIMSEMKSSDDDSFWFLLIPPALGALACFLGYRKFRYGEEVEQIARSARKAASTKGGKSAFDWLPVSASEVFTTTKEFLK